MWVSSNQYLIAGTVISLCVFSSLIQIEYKIIGIFLLFFLKIVVVCGIWQCLPLDILYANDHCKYALFSGVKSLCMTSRSRGRRGPNITGYSRKQIINPRTSASLYTVSLQAQAPDPRLGPCQRWSEAASLKCRLLLSAISRRWRKIGSRYVPGSAKASLAHLRQSTMTRQTSWQTSYAFTQKANTCFFDRRGV